MKKILLILIFSFLFVRVQADILTPKDESRSIDGYSSTLSSLNIIASSGITNYRNKMIPIYTIGLSSSYIKHSMFEFGWNFSSHISKLEEPYFNIAVFVGYGYRIYPTYNLAYVPEIVATAGLTFVNIDKEFDRYSNFFFEFAFRQNLFLATDALRFFIDLGIQKKLWEDYSIDFVVNLGFIFSFDLNSKTNRINSENEFQYYNIGKMPAYKKMYVKKQKFQPVVRKKKEDIVKKQPKNDNTEQ